ncbi:MAG: ArsR family transcriptional regulator [Promethearchaeota archaeon]
MWRRGKDKDKSEKETKEMRKQLRRLQDQIEDLQARLGEEKEAPRERRRPILHDREFAEEMRDFGQKMGERGQELGQYIQMVIRDAMKGANRALSSVFIGPHGTKISMENGEVSIGKGAAERLKPVPPDAAQNLLSPLASAERIKLLYLLAEEPRYHQDLMQESGLAPGTLPHHLKQLEEAGFITQERVRGRYLITIPGRMALKLAEYLYHQMETGTPQEEESEAEEKTEE